MDPLIFLYPRTKFEVLRTLFHSYGSTPLREIAYRSNLTIGSVQTAIKALLKEKIIVSKKINNRTFYQITNNKAYEILLSIFKIINDNHLQKKAEILNLRANKILSLLEERNKIIAKARRSIT